MPQRPAAAALSASDLRAAVHAAGRPIYWAGARAGFSYELTQTADGSFVRYLPPGVESGDARPSFLTIGTYPREGGIAALRGVTGTHLRLRGGGLALIRPAQPTSVYLAFPGSPVQVEVYDPSPADARRIALSGQVVRIS